MGGGVSVGSFLGRFYELQVRLHVCKVGPRGEGGHERSVGGKGVETDPGIDRRASPGRVDDADGDVFSPADLAGEEVSDGGEIFRGVWSARLPDGGDAGQRRIGGFVLHAQQADLG